MALRTAQAPGESTPRPPDSVQRRAPAAIYWLLQRADSSAVGTPAAAATQTEMPGAGL